MQSVSQNSTSKILGKTDKSYLYRSFFRFTKLFNHQLASLNIALNNKCKSMLLMPS